jgi:hypothetical protein
MQIKQKMNKFDYTLLYVSTTDLMVITKHLHASRLQIQWL